ncbi:MAG: GNAT family N-acetyltransferase [Calditrichaeota bacterium]|nr:MAG: GNAT family N-acetyltransferase [Calditrichota bacterium]
MIDRRDWRERYARKWVTAEKAVSFLGRGQRVFIGSGAAEPQLLVKALTRRGHELIDMEIVHLMTLGAAPYADPEYQHVFRHNALFVGANVREAVAEGRADYTPVFLSEIPRLFRGRRIHLDAALIQVSPPDEHGFCSYGVSVDVVKSAAESAELVIAEVNPNMPRTLGDSFIHVSQIDFLVEHNAPLLESIPAEPDEVAMQIGRHVARLIENGSTLQVGIGAIPNAVLRCLGDKKHLGIHTEMFSDGVLELIEAGVIDCSRKTLLPGKVVSSFCIGTRRLYDYVDNNPFFEFRPVEFTNDPFTIARNDRMVAINSAIEVDLTGQVCSDSIGHRFYSGIGGQVDFIRGAARSREGKPIIVIPSTAKNGTISRIVPRLQEGAGVVTTRGDVHYVVTEYGIADLWGKTVRERALALISIAHPKFREQLLEEAKRLNLVYRDQILYPTATYPEELETETTLRDGTRVFFRPVRPTDEPLLKEMFYTLSERTILQRFFSLIKAMPHEKLQKLVNVDYVNEMCIVGVVQEGDTERMVAVGHYVVDPATQMADVAFLVHDDYQGKGIGTFLLRYLIKIARDRGIVGFTADVLADNRPMIHVFHKSGCHLKTCLAEGIYHIEFRFEDRKLPQQEVLT